MANSKAFNTPYLQQYGDAVAKKLCDLFYKKKQVINGEEIMNLASVRQVNMFVLKVLVLQWQAEAQKLRSPMFNYEHPDVKQLLNLFLEKLSFHIAVRREHFEPLLSRAVMETLMLVLDAKQYFAYEIDQLADRLVQIARLRDTRKFYVVNGEILDRFLAEMTSLRKEEGFAGESKLLFVQLIKDNPDLVYKSDDILNQLNQVVQINQGQIFSDGEVDFAHKQIKISGQDNQKPIPAPTAMAAPKPESNQPIAQLQDVPPNLPPVPASKRSHFTLFGAPIDKSKSDTSNNSADAKPLSPEPILAGIRSSEPKREDASKRASILNTAFENHQNSLNDTIGVTEAMPKLKDRIREGRIESIASSIQMVDRYQYVNELFDRDDASYQSAIAELDQARSKQEAIDLLLNSYGVTYGWDFSKSKAANNLVRLVERRFAPVL